MFGWEFPPFINGGLGTACQGIVQGLLTSGIDVTLVLPKSPGIGAGGALRILSADRVDLKGKGGKDGRPGAGRMKLLRFASSARPYDTARLKTSGVPEPGTLSRGSAPGRSGVLDFLGNYGKDLFDEVRNYARIGETLGAGEDFDVIHCHDWLTVPAGIAAKLVSGKPLVLHVHATEYDRSGEDVNRDVYAVELEGMRRADRIIAVSRYTKNVITARYGVPPDKIEVVYNSVAPRPARPADPAARPLKEKIVLFIGRITMQKGPEYFLEAANLVLSRIRDVRFVMAGSGDMMARMISRMASLRLAHRFHFTGFLRGADTDRIYGLSDLFVMPSVSEPFGLTALEALSFDLPVILSRQSGVSEIVPEALTVDFWDTGKMADTMLDVLSDPVRAARTVAACRERIRDWSWDRAGAKISGVYRSVLRNGVS
jgi:glycosyltransferase involved in cell wall biosynthesis